MANVAKKHSISYELEQEMVNAAVVKAKELGVAENVTIPDDGARQDFLNFIPGAPSLLAGIPTPTVQNDVDCARDAMALVSDAVAGGTNS